LGCFAIAWNGFMTVFTAIAVSALLGNGRFDGSPIAFALVITLFWGVGLGLAWTAIKLRFERTLVYLSPERAVMQKNLWGWKSKTEVSLGEEPGAELVEAYNQNDVPVYRIDVRGADRRLGFGTGLAEEEKNRTVDLINEFFGVKPVAEIESAGEFDRHYPDSCAKCGAPLPGEPIAGVLTCGHCQAMYRGEPVPSGEGVAAGLTSFRLLRPDELPARSAIRVEADADDRLVLDFPSTDQAVARYAIPAFALPFSLAWYAGITTFVAGVQNAPWPVRIGFTLFAIPFFIAGAMPLGLGLFLLLGRMRVSLDRDLLSVRWSVGPAGYTRKLPTAQLQTLRLEQSGDRDNPRVRGSRLRSGGRTSLSTAVARTDAASLMLTMMHSEELSRDVISLLSTRLADWGQDVRGG